MTNDKLEEFKKHWLEEISKIQNATIDEKAFSTIINSFISNRIRFRESINGEYTAEERVELQNLESKLRIALEKSRSNYALKEKEFQAKNIESTRGIIKGILDKIPKG